MFQTISRRCRRRDERGAALVEFALILPVLMCLLLGMVSGGMAYNRKISMANAVREGSRFGATLPVGALLTATDWNVAAAMVRARVLEIAVDADLQPNQVCVRYLHVTTPPAATVMGEATSPACAAGADPNLLTSATAESCVVSVWSERNSELQAFFFTWDVTLKNIRALARYERTSSC